MLDAMTLKNLRLFLDRKHEAIMPEDKDFVFSLIERDRELTNSQISRMSRIRARCCGKYIFETEGISA